ncbi:hypothetical protein H6763_03675 [Candidatus Nomurabacteria bacterium]|nr:hypothetical protein [Candidatus Nomurabacteria bacterium]
MKKAGYSVDEASVQILPLRLRHSNNPDDWSLGLYIQFESNGSTREFMIEPALTYRQVGDGFQPVFDQRTIQHFSDFAGAREVWSYPIN